MIPTQEERDRESNGHLKYTLGLLEQWMVRIKPLYQYYLEISEAFDCAMPGYIEYCEARLDKKITIRFHNEFKRLICSALGTGNYTKLKDIKFYIPTQIRLEINCSRLSISCLCGSLGYTKKVNFGISFLPDEYNNNGCCDSEYILILKECHKNLLENIRELKEAIETFDTLKEHYLEKFARLYEAQEDFRKINLQLSMMDVEILNIPGASCYLNNSRNLGSFNRDWNLS